jgi:radical SAM protein with 4Fe4S-binding SPASM domain
MRCVARSSVMIKQIVERERYEGRSKGAKTHARDGDGWEERKKEQMRTISAPEYRNDPRCFSCKLLARCVGGRCRDNLMGEIASRMCFLSSG